MTERLLSERRGPRPATLLALLPLSVAAGSCVTVDAQTGAVVPRGDQRYEFERVKEYAEKLEVGMTKLQVLATVGSPAEKSQRGDQWLYLPERPAILVPSRALRLEFEDDRLTQFGYHSIVLGQQL
ncbi:MAG: outer membrane protein assembly factor BamE [Planctomycetota bacterium]